MTNMMLVLPTETPMEHNIWGRYCAIIGQGTTILSLPTFILSTSRVQSKPASLFKVALEIILAW